VLHFLAELNKYGVRCGAVYLLQGRPLKRLLNLPSHAACVFILGEQVYLVAFGDNGLAGQLLDGDPSTFEAAYSQYIKTTTLTDMPLGQLGEQIRVCGTKAYNLFSYNCNHFACEVVSFCVSMYSLDGTPPEAVAAVLEEILQTAQEQEQAHDPTSPASSGGSCGTARSLELLLPRNHPTSTGWRVPKCYDDSFSVFSYRSASPLTRR
jgi:hypothetical protein